ncbi:c2H2-type domain-containing protein [Caerostris darwini]|uniref:C2H2-type domain-containing protein n=1 Tax=Caerostris darwini TaxID=1538125 RepID=A0AAV4NHN7_9ARAC|nr:c2H2-type domain-containing protein [Caerostris darwini]
MADFNYKHAATAADDDCEDHENENSLSDESSSDSDFDFEFRCDPCSKTFSGIKPLRQHEKGSKHLRKIRQKLKEKEVANKLEESIQEDYDEDILLQPPFAICKTCKKEFMSPESFHQHLKSVKHAKKIAAAKLLESLKNEDGLQKLKEKYKKTRKTKCLKGSEHFAEGASGSSFHYSSDDSSNEDMIADTQEFECQECEKVFSGVNPWYQHLISKSHEKKLKQKELMNQLRDDAKVTVTEGSPLEEDVLVCDLCHVAFSGPENASTHIKSKKHAKQVTLKAWKKDWKKAAKEGKLEYLKKKDVVGDHSLDANKLGTKHKTESSSQQPNQESEIGVEGVEFKTYEISSTETVENSFGGLQLRTEKLQKLAEENKSE